MTHHSLKCHPAYFAQLWNGEKNFELRKNDRDFKVGDIVTLKEWDPEKDPGEAFRESPQFEYDQRYTGRELTKRVSYVLQNFEGLADGYCIFALRPIRSSKLTESCTERERMILDILMGQEG